MNSLRLLLILSFSVLSSFSVVRADVLTQTLSGKGGEEAIFSIAGHWVEDNKKGDLQLLETSAADEFSFTYEEQGNKWSGVLEASYYDKRVVLQIDLSKLRLNSQPIISLSQPVYWILGAVKKGDGLIISSLDQQKFRKLLSKHFYASTIEGKCLDVLKTCNSEIKKHYMLSPKNTQDMNKDFAYRFNSIFPAKTGRRFRFVE